MAGEGRRFKNEGYKDIKPLINVSGRPMALISAMFLPRGLRTSFVFSFKTKGIEKLCKILDLEYKNPNILFLNKKTNGQATTAFLSIKKLKKKNILLFEPITFAPCDSGVIYDNLKLQKLLKREDTDIIVWSARGHINAIKNPNMYGWIDEINNEIRSISVKKPLKNPNYDPIAIGIFTFKKVEFFENSYFALLNNDNKINGEFFIDSMINEAINLGIKCRNFDVSHYISWGTPAELNEYEYWENFFKANRVVDSIL